MDHRLIRRDTEHVLIQLGLLRSPAGATSDGNFHRYRLRRVLALDLRIMTSAPVAPGTDPLIATIECSGSTATTCTRFAVRWSPPMRPAIRVPLNTRPGVVPAPTAPGARQRSD